MVSANGFSIKSYPVTVEISAKLVNLFFLKNVKGPPLGNLERTSKSCKFHVLLIFSRSAEADCISEKALESSFQTRQLRLFQNIAACSLRAPNRLSPKHLLKNHSKSMVFWPWSPKSAVWWRRMKFFVIPYLWGIISTQKTIEGMFQELAAPTIVSGHKWSKPVFLE